MFMAGVEGQEKYDNALAILLEMGEFFQVQTHSVCSLIWYGPILIQPLVTPQRSNSNDADVAAVCPCLPLFSVRESHYSLFVAAGDCVLAASRNASSPCLVLDPRRLFGLLR